MSRVRGFQPDAEQVALVLAPYQGGGVVLRGVPPLGRPAPGERRVRSLYSGIGSV